jgi:hypothetical protein
LVERLSRKLQEKAGGEKECSHFRSRKRKKGVKRKNRKDRVSCTAKKAALAIFVGGCPNRTHSGHYGLKVYLCNIHHLAGTGPEAVHANKKIMAMLHEDGQRAFEENWGSRTEFMKIFGKNFIMED